MIALALLGVLIGAVGRWLELSRSWIYLIAVLVGAVAVYLVMRSRRNQV